MRWEQRKPLWPIVAALGVLMILALIAPRSWQSPSAAPQRQPALESQSASQPTESTITDGVASGFDTSTDNISLTTVPVLDAPQLAEVDAPLPMRREFDFDTLVRVRDQLLTLLDQAPKLPQPTAKSTPAPTASAQTVRVASENDRLAMLPQRRRTNRKPITSVVTEQSAAKEESEFAAILLEAARYPQPARTFTSPTTRVAMAPTAAQQVKPAAPSLPPAYKQPVEAPAIVNAPVAQTPALAAPPALPPAMRHRPQALIAQLEAFSPNSPGALWSQQVLASVRRLTEESPGPTNIVPGTMARLEQLYTLGVNQSQPNANAKFSNRWQQSVQALGRRLVLWRLLLDRGQAKLVESSPATVALLPLLDKAATRLVDADNGDDWREYLILDRIAELTSEGIESPTLARSKLAQEILSRMADPQLTPAQVDFLSNDEFIQLREALRPWAAGKVNLETLAALIERYESGGQIRYAEVIAQLQQRLKWSDDPKLQLLANHLEQHYRGANMRIAMSDQLMNRMLPQQKAIVSPVRESIAGAKVRGSARTTTQLKVRLKPDPAAWHVSLEANGKVYSNTRSDTWPARIRNAARLHYQGSKDITVSEDGLNSTPAKATARGRNELVGVDSQLDPIPIVGHLLRDMARKKHKKSRPAANSQAKAKVVRQVKQRMDAGLEEKLDNFEQKFRDKVLAPIEELALLAEPLDMHTTQERAVMQLRLANTGQLAAHTLRPYAPSDSVLSVQMHETALNNAMMGLGLDGRRMTMLELFDFITQRLGKTDATPPVDMPQHAVIQFAKRDALRIRCEGDRLEMVMSVAELSHRRDRIKNFEIHVHFRPVLTGLGVSLVRDGTLQFSGRRLKTGPRVVLHSILGKVLSEDQQYTLVSPKLMLDPRFSGLMVTQLVLEDGWIGLAIGPSHPRRTAWRAPMPEVLPTPFVR